jgi:prepilin signal peptidase PulO-like enzyme (type II secretory pathway)
MFLELIKNQIALAMAVFIIIVVGAFITLDSATIKEVIVQVITAVGALVTGQIMNSGRGQRAADQIEKIDDKAAVAVAKAEAAQVVKEAEAPKE